MRSCSSPPAWRTEGCASRWRAASCVALPSWSWWRLDCNVDFSLGTGARAVAAKRRQLAVRQQARCGVNVEICELRAMRRPQLLAKPRFRSAEHRSPGIGSNLIYDIQKFRTSGSEENRTAK
jgi:hypothetical protein